jgi:hypothetical protein
MATTPRYFSKGIELRGETADLSGVAEGTLFHNSTVSKLKIYIATAIREIITADQAQTLTNKTINAANNTISNINTTHLASGVLDIDLTSVSASDDTIPSAKAVKTYVDASTLLHDSAAEVSFSPTGAIVATDTQAAVAGVSLSVENHKSNATGAHAASAISVTPTGNLSASNGQSALVELQVDIDTRALDSNLTTHTSATAAHGATGAVVGTTNVQTLTNKTLTAPSITSPTGIVKGDVGLGNVDNTSDATKNSAAVNLTNKTITSASIVTPTRLDMKQDTLANLQTYAATAADGQLVFATDTKATYVVKSSALSAVGGSGVSNYISASGADDGIGAWITYADAAATSPVDGIGGSPTLTFATSATTPLRGTASFLATKSAANLQGNGFSIPFTIDSADKGRVLQANFDYKIFSGTYADNDMVCYIYDVTNSRLIQPSAFQIKNSGIIEVQRMEFQSNSDSTSYRLIVHISSVSALAYSVQFDNFFIGTQAKSYGSLITDWALYTPTYSAGFGTVATSSVYYRRSGDSIEIQGTFVTGTVAASAATLTLPTGLSIDANKLATGGQPRLLGFGGRFTVGVPNTLSVIYGSATTIGFSRYADAGTNGTNGPQTGTAIFGTGESESFYAKMPILGWSSSSQVLNNDYSSAVVALTANSMTATTVVTANNPIVFTTIGSDVTNSYSTSTGKFTAPVSGFYSVSVFADTTSFVAGSSIYASVNNTTSGLSNSRVILGINSVANFPVNGSGIVYALAGQTIDVRPSASFTCAATASLSIQKLAGSQQVLASDSVSALYTGAPPTGTLNGSLNTITFGTKVKDTHNAYSGGSYTVPSSGCYDVSAEVLTAGTFAANSGSTLSVFIDGTEKYSKISRSAAVNTVCEASINVKSIPLLAGQVLTIRAATDATSPTFNATAAYNFFSITRSGNY